MKFKKFVKKIDYLFVLVLILAVVPVAIGASIWFYGDTYRLLSFSVKHSQSISSIISLFVIGAFGVYRPLTLITFALLYRFFGQNSAAYILFMAFCFSISAGFLYLIGKKIKNRLAGLISALVYLTFFPTYSSMWWINNMYDALVLPLSAFSIYCLLVWVDNKKKAYLFWSFFASILAYFAKPSAMFIGPLIFAYGFFIYFRKKKSYQLMAIGFSLSILFVLCLVLPQLLPTVWWYQGAEWKLSNIKYNLLYYLQLQLSFTGIGLLLIALLDRPRRLIYPFLTILICIAFMFFLVDKTLLLNLHFPAFLGLLALGFLLGPKEKRFAIFWIFIGLVSALQFGWTAYRYQSESSLGLALLIGLGVSNHISNLKYYWLRIRKQTLLLTNKPLTLISLVLIPVILFFSAFRIVRKDFLLSKNEVTHLTYYSHNVRETVEYLLEEFESSEKFIMALNSDYRFNSEAVQTALNLYPERRSYQHKIYYAPDVQKLNLLELNDWRVNELDRPAFDFKDNYYLIGDAQMLKGYFARYSQTDEMKINSNPEYFLEHEFINFVSQEPLDIKLVKNKNIAVSLPSFYSVQSQNKDYPGELIYRLEADRTIEKLKITCVYFSPQFEPYRNSFRGYYSLDGESYKIFFDRKTELSTFRSRWYPGVVISPEIRPGSKVVYLKFELMSNVQLISRLRERPQVIINNSAGLEEGDSFKLIFSKGDNKKDILLLNAKVEKIVGKDGYSVGVVKLEMRQD